MRYVFGLLLILSAQAWGAGIHKWVDDKGVTHYGDAPASLEGSKGQRAVSDAERQAAEAEAAKKRETEHKEAERRRRDNALLDTYTSEKEIDLARDRNLQSAQLSIDSTQSRVKSIQGRLDGLRKQADAATRSKRAVPADIAADISAAEAEIRQLQGNIAKHRQDMEAIRARFEDDKKRFRELRGSAPSGS